MADNNEDEDIRGDPDYRDLVGIVAKDRNREERIRVNPAVAEEEFTADQVNNYIHWRALNKTWREAADLTNMSEAAARVIEATEDIVDYILAERQAIIANPFSEILSMLPEAMGMLREKVQAGHLGAIQEVMKIVRDEKMKNSDTDKDAKDSNETERSARSAKEREQLEDVSKRIIEKYGGSRRSNPK